jgi:hypothetical protein
MESDILPKVKVACTDPENLQYLNNPIFVLSKVEWQRSELTRYAFLFANLLSRLLDSCPDSLQLRLSGLLSSSERLSGLL